MSIGSFIAVTSRNPKPGFKGTDREREVNMWSVGDKLPGMQEQGQQLRFMPPSTYQVGTQFISKTS
jgi:hypothetical protein